MARTDIHSPKNLITEDYDFFACGWYGSAGLPGYSPLNSPMGQKLLADGWHFGENESAGDCYHCGAHLKYYAILMHKPSHTLIRVGETCLDNRFGRATEEFHKLRKQAQLDRERQRIKTHREEWYAEDPQRREAYDWATEQMGPGGSGDTSFYHNFVSKVDRYGDTSDKFVAAMIRDKAKQAEWKVRRAQEEAEKKPVVEGKGITIEGEVVSVKIKYYHDDARQVMTVKDDRGFLAWGTVPSAISDVQKGDRVSFVANVEKSESDECFGFYSRPRKAVITEQIKMEVENA